MKAGTWREGRWRLEEEENENIEDLKERDEWCTWFGILSYISLL